MLVTCAATQPSTYAMQQPITKKMNRIAGFFVALCSLVSIALAQQAIDRHSTRSADVIVYGGTPAGIAAALAAADDGRTVLLIEPTSRLGGLATCGLSHTDFRTFESLTGTYLDFSRRVAAYYAKEYGPDSPQAQAHLRGTHAEPKVNLAIFEEMLAERSRIVVLRSHVLQKVEVRELEDGRLRVVSITFLNDSQQSLIASGDVFIDAGYEGDLMAAAKVPYKIGREGKGEFGESLAPDQPDDRLQGYNFRLTMTTETDNQAPVKPPSGYRRADYAEIVPMLQPKKLVRVFGREGERVVFKAQTPSLPNGKYDINDVSHGAVRLSLPSENLAWPDGDAQVRRKLFAEHVKWNVGLLYFLQNDAEVPEPYRADARRWAFCRDEFAETDHLPPQLYVREARRMRGVYVFTQRDCDYAENDARAVLRTDAIAAGDYGPNCHGTDHEGSRFGGKHTGEFYKAVAAYQIPYGVLLPHKVANLMVTTAVSASHVGFCALRFEPIWMSLGQAAGHAAAISLHEGVPVRKVSVEKLQARLHTAGSATIYVSDVPPGHADFAAVQWWGTAGGLHGLYPPPQKPGQRGEFIVGQYFQAFPGHAVELETPLTETLSARWTLLAGRLAVATDKLPQTDGRTTRGDWLRAAYASHLQSRGQAAVND